jgi:hypothetical protein
MYEQAYTIDDMITVESRISEVNSQINKLTTNIAWMDRDVAYSTVTISIEEVRTYSETVKDVEDKTFIDKWAESFVDACDNLVEFAQNLVISLTYNIFTLIILAVIIFLIVKLVKRILKKHPIKKKKKTRYEAVFNGSTWMYVPVDDDTDTTGVNQDQPIAQQGQPTQPDSQVDNAEKEDLTPEEVARNLYGLNDAEDKDSKL